MPVRLWAGQRAAATGLVELLAVPLLIESAVVTLKRWSKTQGFVDGS